MSSRVIEVSVSSTLGASRAEVWDAITSFAGINRELFPLLRMTTPPGVDGLPRPSESNPEVVPLGKRLFRSWILLMCILPIEYDDIVLAEITPLQGFRETSTMLSMRAWQHDRRLEDVDGGGCRLVDRLTFEPKVRALGGVMRWVVALVFRHRHRRLRRMFGGRP